MKRAVERIKALGRHELFVAVVVLAAVLAPAFPEVAFGGKAAKAFYQQLLTLERGQGV